MKPFHLHVQIVPEAQKLKFQWCGQSHDVAERFGSKESVDEITYGVCNVFIPESHKPGTTGTPWWRRWIRLESDDSLKVHGTHGSDVTGYPVGYG